MRTVDQPSPPLVAGDKLDRGEFLRRWHAHPEIKRAELIAGIVYTPSPVTLEHGDMEGQLGLLLGTYAEATPGTKISHNTTSLLREDSPQPDLHLRILPEFGGLTRLVGDYLAGPPELVVEICRSSAAYDLHQKLELYEQAGVPEYLAVLLYEQEIRWHCLAKDHYQLLPPDADGVWRSPRFPGLWLDGKALLESDMATVLARLGEGIRSPKHADFVTNLALHKSKTGL